MKVRTLDPVPFEDQILVGDVVEFHGGCNLWHWGPDRIAIPDGTRGTIMPWDKGCAVKINGFTHPRYLYFPMVLTPPGSRRPWGMNLISRRPDEGID